MNLRIVGAIVRKDLKVVGQSKTVLLPIIIVPLIFMVALPALAALGPSAITQLPLSGVGSSLSSMLANMPAGLQAELAGLNEQQTFVALFLLYFLAPMYLIVPLMVASVLASDSFAGEKERKTLEALLYTPATDRELFLAKMLSAWLPAVAVGLAGFVLYGLTANLAGWPVMGRIFFPNATWVILALWVSPAVAALGLGVTVLVSARVNTFQEAYQMGGMVVLPVLLLVAGQATGLMYFNIGLVLLLGLFVWLIDAGLLWVGGRSFRRSEMIAKM